METLIQNQKLHSLHNEWLNKLSFYKDDLAVWQRRLEEIVKQNTSKEMMVKVEQFQNQVTLQREQIDILRHEVKAEENILEKLAAGENVPANTNADYLKENIIRFEELFADFRKNIMNSLSRWM